MARRFTIGLFLCKPLRSELSGLIAAGLSVGRSVDLRLLRQSWHLKGFKQRVGFLLECHLAPVAFGCRVSLIRQVRPGFLH